MSYFWMTGVWFPKKVVAIDLQKSTSVKQRDDGFSVAVGDDLKVRPHSQRYVPDSPDCLFLNGRSFFFREKGGDRKASMDLRGFRSLDC